METTYNLPDFDGADAYGVYYTALDRMDALNHLVDQAGRCFRARKKPVCPSSTRAK